MTFPVIAVDGPAASGKGTVARRLAAHFGFAHLDTGLLYRAVGLAVVRQKGDPANASTAEKAALALDPARVTTFADDPELRSEEASFAASKVAGIEGVRAALLKFQQDFCIHPPGGMKGAVLDGRDIGTIIAPQAPVKIYVTASPDVRAQRRFKELQAKELQGGGGHVTYAAVLADMKERDARDAARSIAPSKPAPDAVILDTSGMNAEAAFEIALRIASEKLKPAE